MDNNIPEINDLIKQFSKLPGLGPKSAKRIILKLINNKDGLVKPLARSLAQVYKSVVRCVDCGNLKIIDKNCICKIEMNYNKICVVSFFSRFVSYINCNEFINHQNKKYRGQ